MYIADAVRAQPAAIAQRAAAAAAAATAADEEDGEEGGRRRNEKKEEEGEIAQKRVSGDVDCPSVRNGRGMCCLYPNWGTSVEVLICTKILGNRDRI